MLCYLPEEALILERQHAQHGPQKNETCIAAVLRISAVTQHLGGVIAMHPSGTRTFCAWAAFRAALRQQGTLQGRAQIYAQA